MHESFCINLMEHNPIIRVQGTQREGGDVNEAEMANGLGLLSSELSKKGLGIPAFCDSFWPSLCPTCAVPIISCDFNRPHDDFGYQICNEDRPSDGPFTVDRD